MASQNGCKLSAEVKQYPRLGGILDMKKMFLVMAIMIAAALLALPAYAQDAPKKDAPPKPAVSPSQALLESWNDVGRKLTAMMAMKRNDRCNMVDPILLIQKRA